MSQDNELRRLEQFVEKLLARFNDLREEKSRLQEELRERERVIGELRQSLAVREEERSEITQRVGKMVEQIEEWEAALGGEQFEAAATPVVEELPEEAEDIEEPDTPLGEPRHAEEVRTQEEGRVQHNLFSLGAGNR